ncbi:LysR substrate-binding domain-containing protein [Aeromonas sp. FDAARGOS 1415]|uniref:LysR substrate-binding domain-containing protein n=1 Tax=Aeromonas TaxID=642 RepID=UPI001C239F68|nr:LysR substrate-binding domain-containing protein [Aeromonas sp. FDAARGOS 1415]QXB54057.1 LysR family transcriptional regulator [Aeromonas sp. FDAARGOS 1415]
MKLTLQQLKVFATIARHGNLGQAANELCLSKGAVSQALQELERQLGTPLFDRVHPRLQLNSEGRLLQPAAEEMLTRMQEIEQLFSPDAEPSGQLRLGASQTIGNYLLPSLLAGGAGDQGAAPRVTIANTHLLCHALAHFELDLALIEGENHHPELVSEPWLEDEMLIIAPPHHPLAGEAELPLQRLADETWVLREHQSGSREQFEQQIQPRLPRWRAGIELNTLEAVMLAVEKGLGISFVSRLAVSDRLQQGRLVALTPNRRFPRQLSLAWHRQKFHSAALRRFLAFCRAQSLP